MQTIDELATDLGLTPEQKATVEAYIKGMVVELLEGIKEDHIQNIEETVKNLDQ